MFEYEGPRNMNILNLILNSSLLKLLVIWNHSLVKEKSFIEAAINTNWLQEEWEKREKFRKLGTTQNNKNSLKYK